MILEITPHYPDWLTTIVMGGMGLALSTIVVVLLTGWIKDRKAIEKAKWDEIKETIRSQTHTINIVDIKTDSIIDGFAAVNHGFNTEFVPKQQESYTRRMQGYRDRHPELFEK